MVSIKFVLLAIALLAIVHADAAGRYRPGKKRHSQGDEPATFLLSCEVRTGDKLHSVPCRSSGIVVLTRHPG